MTSFKVQVAASYRLDDIYTYSRNKWGVALADRYINGLFETFAKIQTRRVASRPIPAEFGVAGYYCKYEQHLIYWRNLSDGSIGIVTILHERMHQLKQYRDDNS